MGNLRNFSDWLLMAEEEHKDKFEKKHKKRLNIARIVGLGLIVFLVPIFLLLIDSLNLQKWTNFLIYLIFVLIASGLVYFTIRLYWEWIKILWHFLSKDSIVHYIFLGIIPAVSLFLGFRYFILYKKAYIAGSVDEIINRLTGFYSALFTAIAVIAAILAISAWRGFKEMKEKLDRFKDFEGKVKFVKEKKDLAEWVQDRFEKDAYKKYLTSISFELTEKEEKKLKEIEKNILEETTDDGFLKLVYAKQLMAEREKNKPSGEDGFVKIDNIFD
ncbi:MAG: hypothetical protein JSV88_08105 [Candidatus Aminicenantes bacterium]|nr:MAG: hypothetical protein JSV88_08105 [Candidatus Aminicenantes bacterium]